MFDILEEIWATARRNRLRTVLTGFAVAWGIFMIIFLLGAGNGFINAVEHNTSNFLANSMQVSGGRTSKAYEGMNEGREITLNDRDMQTTMHKHTNVVRELGAQVTQGGVQVSYGTNYVSGTICGVYPNLMHINKIEMLYGRFVNDMDNDQRRKAMVISENQAKELVDGDIATLVGKNVKVDNSVFQIVGIYKSDLSQMNTQFYCPFSTVRTIYNRGDEVENIIFSFDGLNSVQENEDFEKLYTTDLNTNHHAAPDDGNAIWIWNRFTQNLQMNTGMSIIRTALWIIGIFTLLSGIVGVSNIMLITVKERTREFGVRKAIGATPWSILRLIIVESVIITTFFGYIGMLLGIGANAYLDATAGSKTVDSGLFELTIFLNPTVGLGVCLEATLVMIVAGTIAGLVPARRAAHIKPIDALRAE
ncbi:ABC transporter permease [Hallella bergensis]|uniref:ABC transporter permease n=1 Tax=Hallella bergensis TaxID=242750 RepID=UPI0039904B78